MNRKPCIFFQKGSCRNGDNCRFSHSSGGPGNDSNPSNSNMGSRNDRRPPNRGRGSRGRGSRGRGRGRDRDRDRNPSNNNFNERYPNNGGGHMNSKPNNNQMNVNNSPNVNKTFEALDLKELNYKRKGGGLSNLIISSSVQLGQMVLLVLKNEQFVVIFKLDDNQFIPNPLYINCDINEKILGIKSGSFGNIEGDFIFVNYINFNNLSLQYSSRLLITPLASLDKHKTFLILDISMNGEINEFFVDHQVILTAVFDKATNSSELKMAMIAEISQHSNDLKQLSKMIETNFNSIKLEGKVTLISRIGTNVIVALSTGRLFVLDVATSNSQYIENINGETILLQPAGNPASGEVSLVTSSGDLKLATLANPLQCKLTNQMNTPLLKAKCLLVNQGKL